MKIKRVNRYYCDYCAKSGCAGGHMKSHEQHCTLNPERVCRMCRVMNATQTPMIELLALLPSLESLEFPSDEEAWDGKTFTDINGSLAIAFPKLRAKAHNCPACILAALRQKKIPVPMVTEFNYSAEREAIWQQQNEERMEDY